MSSELYASYEFLADGQVSSLHAGIMSISSLYVKLEVCDFRPKFMCMCVSQLPPATRLETIFDVHMVPATWNPFLSGASPPTIHLESK